MLNNQCLNVALVLCNILNKLCFDSFSSCFSFGFGKLGQCSINGSLVCRNEGLQYSSKLYLNWDMRLYSGSSETVDNDQVGLAKASDSPPKTVDWRLLAPGVVNFGSGTDQEE